MHNNSLHSFIVHFPELLSTLVKCQIPTVATAGRVVHVQQGFTLSHRRFKRESVFLICFQQEPSTFNTLIAGRPWAQPSHGQRGLCLQPVITQSLSSVLTLPLLSQTRQSGPGYFFAWICSDKRLGADGITEKSCLKWEGRRLKKKKKKETNQN